MLGKVDCVPQRRRVSCSLSVIVKKGSERIRQKSKSEDKHDTFSMLEEHHRVGCMILLAELCEEVPQKEGGEVRVLIDFTNYTNFKILLITRVQQFWSTTEAEY